MHDPPGAMLPADFFIALSSCAAQAGHPAARGRAAFSKRYGVLNQPLQCAIAHKADDDGPDALHHEQDR